MAIRAEIQGIVLIEFEIDENGTSKNIRVIKDIGGECAEQAVYAISKTKFIPANILNKNIESRYRIAVRFILVE